MWNIYAVYLCSGSHSIFPDMSQEITHSDIVGSILLVVRGWWANGSFEFDVLTAVPGQSFVDAPEQVITRRPWSTPMCIGDPVFGLGPEGFRSSYVDMVEVMSPLLQGDFDFAFLFERFMGQPLMAWRIRVFVWRGDPSWQIRGMRWQYDWMASRHFAMLPCGDFPDSINRQGLCDILMLARERFWERREDFVWNAWCLDPPLPPPVRTTTARS